MRMMTTNMDYIITVVFGGALFIRRKKLLDFIY